MEAAYFKHEATAHFTLVSEGVGGAWLSVDVWIQYVAIVHKALHYANVNLFSCAWFNGGHNNRCKPFAMYISGGHIVKNPSDITNCWVSALLTWIFRVQAELELKTF